MNSKDVITREKISFPIGEQLYNISISKVKAVIDETFQLHQGEFKVNSYNLKQVYKFHDEEASELAHILDKFHSFCSEYITRTYKIYYQVDLGCRVSDSSVWFYWDKVNPKASDCSVEHLR